MTSATEGFTDAGLERLHATADRHVGDERIPGLVALVARGEQVHVEVLGNLTIDGPPVSRDSLFRLSSTTKPITAAATLAFIEEGLIGLEEPADRLLPELANRRVLRRMDGALEDTVPAERAITTRDLLTFTFGFGMALEMFMSPSPWPKKAQGGLGSDFFKGRSWGFCQAVQDDGSYGWAGGFGSTWLVDPARQLIVIVLSQRMFESAGAPQAHEDIQAAAYSALA